MQDMIFAAVFMHLLDCHHVRWLFDDADFFIMALGVETGLTALSFG